jgi:hypothetical protein
MRKPIFIAGKSLTNKRVTSQLISTYLESVIAFTLFVVLTD